MDDVFQPQFNHNIAFVGCKEDDVEWDPSATATLEAWGVQRWTFAKDHASYLPPGPYVWYLGRAWQLLRVYDDTNLTMVTTFKPKAPLTGDSK